MRTPRFLHGLLVLSMLAAALPFSTADTPPTAEDLVKQVGTRLAPAFVVTFDEPDAPILVAFPSGEWTAEVVSVGERHTLLMHNARGDLVGEMTMAWPGTPILLKREMEQLVYSVETRRNDPLPEAPDPTQPQPETTGIIYCAVNQICVGTRVNEGCADCIHHWGRVQSPGSAWYYFDGCDQNHGCANIASIYQPGQFYESGWICRSHQYLWWNFGANAFSRIHSGGTVIAQDTGITYWDDKGC